MDNWITPQIEYLLLLQNFRELTHEIFNDFFMFMTLCGEITIPFILAAGLYWCINSKYGMYIFWNWSIGTVINQFLKLTACIYRPWYLDSRVQPVPEAFKMAGGYSFPSGHSQTAVSTWGALAVCYKNKIFRFAMIVLILLIGFSRNYLGVHTPQDVIVSFVVAGISLWLITLLMKWVEKGKNRDLIVLIGAILLSVGLIAYGHFKSYPIDYIDGKLFVDPVKMRFSTYRRIGLLLGIMVGWFIDRRWIHFNCNVGTKIEKIVRFIIGAILLGLLSNYLRGGLDYLTTYAKIISFVNSFLIAFFVVVIYPLCVMGIRKYILKKDI